MRVIRIIALLFSLCTTGTAQREPENIPFYPGEEMYYLLHMGFLSLGECTISFKADSLNCGSFLYANAGSTGFAKFIKNIRYEFGSCINPSTGRPNIATSVVQEGSHYVESEVYFDHDLRPDSSIVYSKDFGSKVVTKDIFDLISAMYYFRSNYASENLEKIKRVTFTTFCENVTWDLTIRYAGKETVNTMFGPMVCLKFMPVTEVGTYFRTTDDMIIWVTNDQDRIPVKIYVDLKVGSITADLVNYTGPFGE
jgi:hypothetical protein